MIAADSLPRKNKRDEMPSTNGRFLLSSRQYDNDNLELTWGDGHASRYPAVWLQACTCEGCGSTETGVRHVRLTDKPRRPRIHACDYDDSRPIFDWGRGHRSAYPLDWLRTMCLSESSRRQRKFRVKNPGQRKGGQPARA